MMPGTNHCSDSAKLVPVTSASRGPKKARNTTGCTSVNTTENGSRKNGRSSRVNTREVSCVRVFR